MILNGKFLTFFSLIQSGLRSMAWRSHGKNNTDLIQQLQSMFLSFNLTNLTIFTTLHGNSLGNNVNSNDNHILNIFTVENYSAFR